MIDVIAVGPTLQTEPPLDDDPALEYLQPLDDDPAEEW
jgi:hypothetical protein